MTLCILMELHEESLQFNIFSILQIMGCFQPLGGSDAETKDDKANR